MRTESQREEINIDYVFHLIDIPLAYYITAVAIAAIVIAAIRHRNGRLCWDIGILIAYCFLIIVDTILIRTPGAVRYELNLFWSYSRPELKLEIISNIFMFIPVGIFGGALWKWRTVLYAIGFSLMIELVQLISRRGLFEFDDVIHNAAGAAVGVGLLMIAREIYEKTKAT